MLIRKSLLILAPKENTLHQLYLSHLLQRFWLKFCKVHELCVGIIFVAINPKPLSLTLLASSLPRECESVQQHLLTTEPGDGTPGKTIPHSI